MLQYEYKSVYFVCRKPKSPLSILQSTSENETMGNGFHLSDNEVNTNSFSDVDDHDAETG